MININGDNIISASDSSMLKYFVDETEIKCNFWQDKEFDLRYTILFIT